MQVQVYLFFDGRCEEAIEFYKEALGARQGRVVRYQDSPEPLPPGMRRGCEAKVMYTDFQIGDTQVMACDDCIGKPKAFQGFDLSLSVANETEAKRLFAALSDGGKVHMPIAKTFFSPCFGMLEDRFGIGWMVSVPGTG